MVYSETDIKIPPRILTALRVLDHTYCITRQDDVSLPPRALSPLEKSVESAALTALQAYLLGEMDFGDAPPTIHRRDEDGGNPAAVPAPEPQPA